MPLPTKANVTRPRSRGYDALVSFGDTDNDSLYLRLATAPDRPLTIESADPTIPKIRTSESAEDIRPESGSTFSRSVFSGGEGLDVAHRRGGTDKDWSRFWDSRNIDVSPTKPGQPERIRLLHSTAQIEASTATLMRSVVVDGKLFFSNGNDVTSTADPIASSPTFSNEDPHAAEGDKAVLDVTGLGDQVYAAITTNGIHQRTSGGSWSHWSDLLATRVWGVKGRILASTGAALYEAASGAGSTLLHTLPSGETWTSVVDAGSAILAAGSDGLIYAFAPDENAALELVSETPMPRSEYPTALGWAAGFVFVGTGEDTSDGGVVGRLWRFVLAGGTLEEGQNLRVWTATTLDRAPRTIIVTRDAVWTAVIEDATETHVWRYHLETEGVSRDLILGASGLVEGLESIDDRLFATVAGDGLWRETTSHASEGYLISPAADFFSAAAKHWYSVRLHTPADLAGNVLVTYSVQPEAIRDPDDASWTLATKASSLNPGDGTEQPLPDLLSRWLAFKIVLQVGTAGTPEVDAVAFRAFHHPDEIIMQLPVNLSDRVELPGRKPFIVNGLGYSLWEQLKDLEGSQVTLTLLNPADEIRGHVERITTPIPSDSERGSPLLYTQLTVRGQRSPTPQEVEGETWAVPMWGEPLFGGVK